MQSLKSMSMLEESAYPNVVYVVKFRFRESSETLIYVKAFTFSS